MKFLTTIIAVLCTLTIAQAKRGNISDFDIKDFNKKAKEAEWLYKYDKIAWWTSDSVMKQSKEEIARLGGEWFCFETPDKNWHAVYGKYENNDFDLVFHFLVDTTYTVRRIYDDVDTTILNGYSRALKTANANMKHIKDSINIRFNQYIKQNPDKSYKVWIFPAYQPNHYAVFGGEFIYEIDQTGTKVINDLSYYQGQFRGFKVGDTQEAWLNYNELEKPSLGTVFFVWYYKSYIPKIYIDNKNSVSTVAGENGKFTWIHSMKLDDKKKKK
jgi:hypothetical protein